MRYLALLLGLSLTACATPGYYDAGAPHDAGADSTVIPLGNITARDRVLAAGYPPIPPPGDAGTYPRSNGPSMLATWSTIQAGDVPTSQLDGDVGGPSNANAINQATAATGNWNWGAGVASPSITQSSESSVAQAATVNIVPQQSLHAGDAGGGSLAAIFQAPSGTAPEAALFVERGDAGGPYTQEGSFGYQPQSGYTGGATFGLGPATVLQSLPSAQTLAIDTNGGALLLDSNTNDTYYVSSSHIIYVGTTGRARITAYEFILNGVTGIDTGSGSGILSLANAASASTGTTTAGVVLQSLSGPGATNSVHLEDSSGEDSLIVGGTFKRLWDTGSVAHSGTRTISIGIPTDHVRRLFARTLLRTSSSSHITGACALLAEIVVENVNGTMATTSAITSSTNPQNSNTANGFLTSRVEACDSTLQGGAGTPSTAVWTTSGTNAVLTISNASLATDATEETMIEVDDWN